MKSRHLIALVGLVILAVLANLLVSRDGLLLGAFGDLLRGEESLGTRILAELRFPRAILGALVGAGLGASGAALQGFFRNPLADPGIVGVSASSGLGAVIALYFGLAGISLLMIPMAAALGGLVGVGFLLLLAGRRASSTTLILSGVAVSAVASSMTALLMNLSPNPWALAEIAYWLMGSLADANWNEVRFAAPLILAGTTLLVLVRNDLDPLSLGEETARSLGVNLPWLRLAIVLGSALAVGGGVAVAGAIGFIGLVVPHLLRPFVASRPAALLLPSALGGAALLSLADVGTRLLSGPGIPLYLGVLTALLGAPFFVWLVRSTQGRAP
ncbi:iron ABC transporter permease [Maricaulis sp.]|uniref:FecCD family ABC transporter permease n=1 Tax=Maricaulis sp. TaxID=1486257 RepID=UPI001B093A80|nr:iron ABC transporter permease [Maricaulis sp.]MBO6796487.1 iron ABC transporter permease [Maricaulis sp.]